MKDKIVYFDAPYKKECLKAAEKLYSLGWEIYCSQYLVKTFSQGDFAFSQLESEDYYEIRKALKNKVYRDGSFVLKAPSFLVLDAAENCKDEFKKAQMAALVYCACSLEKKPIMACEISDLEKIIEKIKILEELPDDSVSFYAAKALRRFCFRQAYLAETISSFSLEEEFSVLPLKKEKKLAYGENPHQKAYYYSSSKEEYSAALNSYRYVNLNHERDMEKASSLIFRCEEAGLCFFKHGNLAAFSLGENTISAVKKIKSYCGEEIYNGVCCFNRALDERTCEEIIKLGPEIICAPDISKEASKILRKSETSAFVKIPYSFSPGRQSFFYFHKEGFLIQEKDETEIFKDIKVASKRNPSLEELRNLKYASLLSLYVPPYSCVIFSDNSLVSSSGPQPSLEQAAEIAVFKAKKQRNFNRSVKAVAAASAPFGINSLKKIIEAQISAAVCPSYGFDYSRVSDIIEFNKISLVLLPKRHFRH
ncbi:MAG: hypothetical protein GX447_01240 [Elusimicrobia bacterium]|nr:hypothetical protein [Elusimicrobiota bacterium]